MLESAIFKKYNIHPTTFRFIKGRFTGTKTKGWGRIDYGLSKRDEDIIKAAMLCPYTLLQKQKVRKSPFYAYIIFLMFTRPETEILQDLIDKHLIKKGPETAKWWAKTSKKILNSFPKEIQKNILKSTRPAKKNMHFWEVIVDILDIRKLFDNPDYITEFNDVVYDIEQKDLVETLLTTSYEDEEMVNILNKYTASEWTMETLTDYKRFFYNIDTLTEPDWKSYLTIIPVKAAHRKDVIKGKLVDEVLIEQGLMWHEQAKNFLKLAMVKYMNTFRDSVMLRSPEGLRMSRESADMVMKLKEKYDSISEGGEDLAELFEEFRVSRDDFGARLDEKFNR